MNLKKIIERKLLALGYSDDYIVQSVAEELLEEREIKKIIIRIEDDDLTVAEALAEAIRNKEEEKFSYADMSVSEYIKTYCY